MARELGTKHFSDQALISMLTSAQRGDFKENWEHLGYGLDVFARWELTLRHSTLQFLWVHYHSRLQFAEKWWDVSKGDVYRAHEFATFGFEPSEVDGYEQNGFKAVWKMADFREAGYGPTQMVALNRASIRINKSLLDSTDEFRSKYLAFTLLLSSDQELQGPAIRYVAKLMKEESVMGSQMVFDDTVPLAIRKIDDSVVRIFGPGRMENYDELIELFHTQVLGPTLRYGQSMTTPFLEALSSLDSKDQVDTLMSWMKAFNEKSRVPLFSDPDEMEAIKNCVPFEWFSAHGQEGSE